MKNEYKITTRKRKSTSKTKKADKYEAIIRDSNGKTIHTKSGFTSKNKALAYAAKKKVEFENEDIMLEKTKTNATFEDVYKDFLKRGINEYNDSTQYNTTKYYKYFEKSFAHMRIKDINYEILKGYFDSLSKNGIETNKNIKKAMSRIFKFAVNYNYISSSPCTNIKVKGIERHRKTYERISDEDIKRLIDAIQMRPSFQHQAYVMFIKMAYYTGMRVAEILALEKSDIDFEHNTININKTLLYKGKRKEDYIISNKLKTKASKAVIPMSDQLKQYLLDWFEINPFDRVICDKTGDYIVPESMAAYIRKISKKLDIYCHPYIFRHTFASNLADQGVKEDILQELMRHGNFRTTREYYIHKEKQDKLDALNRALGSI